MRSKFLQQVIAKVMIDPQSVALVAGAKVVKGTGFVYVGDNGALGAVRSALFHIFSSVSSSAAMVGTLKIQHSADDVDGNYTDVTLNAALPTLSLTGAAKGDTSFFLKLDGLKTYVRIVCTLAGTGTDTVVLACNASLGDGSVESLPRGVTPPTVYAPAA